MGLISYFSVIPNIKGYSFVELVEMDYKLKTSPVAIPHEIQPYINNVATSPQLSLNIGKWDKGYMLHDWMEYESSYGQGQRGEQTVKDTEIVTILEVIDEILQLILTIGFEDTQLIMKERLKNETFDTMGRTHFFSTAQNNEEYYNELILTRMILKEALNKYPEDDYHKYFESYQ